MKTFVLAALSCTLSSAHVRMTYTGFPIRNAGAPTSDGSFSTSGPCAGVDDFDDDNAVTVNEGEEMELSIAYNGGHKSDTKNFFSVAYICGEPDDFPKVFAGGAVKDNAQINQAFTDAGGVVLTEVLSPEVYPVDATDSLKTGYKIKFLVPKPADTTDGDKCTISLVEYRNWGGCVDVIIKARDPNAPTPPPPPPKSLSYPTEISLAQTYDITNLDYKMKLPTGNTCGGGDCDCKDAIEDKTCLWKQGDDAATKPGECLQCKYKDKANCLCDVSGETSHIRHYGTCARDSPNCLCMDGIVTISHKTSATDGVATLNTIVTDPNKPDQVWSMSTKVPLSEDGRALSTSEPITIVLKSGDETLTQDMMVKTTPGGEGEVFLNLAVVDDAPIVCSFQATMKQDKDEVARQEKDDPRDIESAKASDPAAIMSAGWVTFVVATVLQIYFN